MEKRIRFTLCIVHQHPNVLLGMKKRGFGEGRWNGFGGKVLDGERIEDAAKRECLEEIGIKVENLEKTDLIDFSFEKNPGEILEVHIFKTGEFSGRPQESEEMKPDWFHIDNIPYKYMWPVDIHWIPLCLVGKKFKGKFHFGEGDIILHKELLEVTEV